MTNKSKLIEVQAIQLADNFKFIFYLSFQSKSESVGLEFCEALHNYCKKQNIKNFEVVVRLSREGINPERWDQEFILKELRKHNPQDVRKVWVCGPPPMNEVFEKAIHEITKMDIGFKNQFHIF